MGQDTQLPQIKTYVAYLYTHSATCATLHLLETHRLGVSDVAIAFDLFMSKTCYVFVPGWKRFLKSSVWWHSSSVWMFLKLSVWRHSPSVWMFLKLSVWRHSSSVGMFLKLSVWRHSSSVCINTSVTMNYAGQIKNARPTLLFIL